MVNIGNMTAVEFLFNELEQLIPSECQDVYLKALEMEKQQIVNAYEENMMRYVNGEVYYNEEYNNKRQSRD